MCLSETTLRFRQAFPSGIQDEVDVTFACVPLPKLLPSIDDIGPVVINGEKLRIPFRFYSSEPDTSCLQILTDRQKLILNAIYTRHSNGFVREQQVKPLLFADELWIPPFVIQLLGEYVLEIIRVLEKHLWVFTGPSYIQFARENRPFVRLVRQRIASYWNCYYRVVFPTLKDYPAFRILQLIEASV